MLTGAVRRKDHSPCPDGLNNISQTLEHRHRPSGRIKLVRDIVFNQVFSFTWFSLVLLAVSWGGGNVEKMCPQQNKNIDLPLKGRSNNNGTFMRNWEVWNTIIQTSNNHRMIQQLTFHGQETIPTTTIEDLDPRRSLVLVSTMFTRPFYPLK
jgi:hypothetical protein